MPTESPQCIPLLPVLFTSSALSDPVLFDTVVQHCLLAIDLDRIAVGLSFETPPVCTICKIDYQY